MKFQRLLQRLGSRDPQAAEDAFGALMDDAEKYSEDLIAALGNERNVRLVGWLCELVASLRTSDAVQALAMKLNGPELSACKRESAEFWLKTIGTREACIALYERNMDDGHAH